MTAGDRSYELRVTGPAVRQLDPLPEKVAAAIVEFMLGPLEPSRGGRRQNWVVRRCVGLVAVAIFVGACSGRSDVVDGPAQEDIDNEPPYSAGIEVGETYDYVMYVHCGVRWARIDGVWWEAAPLDDGNGNPPDGWGNPYDAGNLTVVDENTVAYTGGPDVTVRFARTAVTQAPFSCE